MDENGQYLTIKSPSICAFAHQKIQSLQLHYQLKGFILYSVQLQIIPFQLKNFDIPNSHNFNPYQQQSSYNRLRMDVYQAIVEIDGILQSVQNALDIYFVKKSSAKAIVQKGILQRQQKLEKLFKQLQGNIDGLREARILKQCKQKILEKLEKFNSKVQQLQNFQNDSQGPLHKEELKELNLQIQKIKYEFQSWREKVRHFLGWVCRFGKYGKKTVSEIQDEIQQTVEKLNNLKTPFQKSSELTIWQSVEYAEYELGSLYTSFNLLFTTYLSDIADQSFITYVINDDEFEDKNNNNNNNINDYDQQQAADQKVRDLAIQFYNDLLPLKVIMLKICEIFENENEAMRSSKFSNVWQKVQDQLLQLQEEISGEKNMNSDGLDYVNVQPEREKYCIERKCDQIMNKRFQILEELSSYEV